MKTSERTRFLLLPLAGLSIALPACTTVEHDVEVHRYHTRTVVERDHHPAPAHSREFSVVNQYDRDSR